MEETANLVRTASLLALCLLAACSTNQGGYRTTSSVEQRLIGMPIDEVAFKLGAPTNSVDISGSQKIWSYRSDSHSEWQLVGGKCDISVTFEDGIVVRAVVNKTDHSPLSAPMAACSGIIGNLD
ncbi:hypothetical protein [Spongiibacter marinus]|uniref:hypothetical protein n=1 Tax=Spongiibacter marinus TaxID=354246 RepID=UPI0012B65B0C|nr:hypothetical protein [Spongiibacter marinus]